MSWATDNIDIATSGLNYGGGWKMHYPPTNTTLGFETFVRNPHGDYWDADIYAANFSQNGQTGRYNLGWYNPISDKRFITDVVLGHASTGIFHMNRVRLRRWRWTPRDIPQYTRLGNNGEWLMAYLGVTWPWDNAILPRNLLASGI
jgi:hypothetical protein